VAEGLEVEEHMGGDGPAGRPGGVEGRRWVIAANRGPVQFERDDDGTRVQHAGPGGLATALARLSEYLADSVWVCAALTDEDRAVAAEGLASVGQHDGDGVSPGGIRMLDIPPEVFERYYAVVSNPIIWFVQHGLWDLSNAPNIGVAERVAFEHGYGTANEMFADAIVDALPDDGASGYVMIHDYHLYLVGGLVRARRPSAFLLHFIHIPWPQPDCWRILPSWMREPLLRGLLGNDLVAFQTARYARNFLMCCQELLGLEVDVDRGEIMVGDRVVRAASFPISVDVPKLEAMAASGDVHLHERALENVRREYLILRVDRTDLSKNILRGFLAFDVLLERNPDLAGRVTFLALLQPSRQDVPEYAEYTDKILRLVADINLKHGNVEWQPIDLRLENNLEQAIAAFKLFDVLLVNPVSDGLNLVAKEGLLVNERNGTLVLSEHAGVHDEIGRFALTVHPVDIEEQAEALLKALFMPVNERKRRRNGAVDVIRRNDLARWLGSQLAVVRALDRGPQLVPVASA
jgi:trehalose 6-phosphate synthase